MLWMLKGLVLLLYQDLSWDKMMIAAEVAMHAQVGRSLAQEEVFDGIVENMRLHWKYGEMVKDLAQAKTFSKLGRIVCHLKLSVIISMEVISKGMQLVYCGKDLLCISKTSPCKEMLECMR